MQLRQAKTRAEAANKVALEAEKEKDAAEKEVEELKRQMQPKRSHTHDDAGDAHTMLGEVDNWDLSVYQSDLLDRRPICCHSIIRDSGLRHEGCRDCGEGATKGQTWEVGMRTGSRALVIKGGDARASWTQQTAEVWEGCGKHELRREGVHIGPP